MSEDIVTRLQAMYHSGQVSSFINSKLQNSALPTGWIEHGLIGKGFSGNIQERKIQENLVIPIDRFVRLFLESDSDNNHGLLILGNLDSSKLVTLVSNLHSKDSETWNVIGLNSGEVQIRELLDFTGRFLVGEPPSKEEEPSLDYIEELLSDVANGNVKHLISLSLQPEKQKTVSWIKKILNTDLTSDVILAKSTNPQEISSTILLLTRWLLGLDLFSKTKNAIASILLVRNSDILLCFWNNSQKIATFASLEGFSTTQVLSKYVLPLWYSPLDVSKRKPPGPKVVIEKTRKQPLHEQKKTPSKISDSQSQAIVRTRLSELNARFSSLISHISNIRKRISKLSKNAGNQIMSEHSEKAIEELRRIEQDTKVIEDISTRLQDMEKQIENAGSSLSSDEIQRIVSKMTALRILIDKIDVEIGQLDSRVSEIESLKFKRQTES
jgi:hypothetical protein